MYTRVVSEKSAAQQRTFEAALLDLLEEKLFENISISELCRVAGLSRKIFYRLYDAKADVVYAMIDHAVLDTNSFVPDETVGQGGMHHFLAYWKSQKRLLDVLAKNRISLLLSQQAIALVLEEEPDIVNSFSVGNADIRREMVTFCVTGLFTLVLDWHQRGFDRSIDEMARILMEVVTTAPVKEPLISNIYIKQ